jgi:hypothetical protein
MKNKLITFACASILTIGYAHASSADDHHSNTSKSTHHSKSSEKAHPSKSCSLKTLKGTYLSTSSGKNINGFDFADAGFLNFDGNGNVSVTNSSNGNTTVNTYSSTYTINSLCIGSIVNHTETSSIGDDTHYNMFADPDGSNLTFVQTDLGSVVSGTIKRVAK